MNNHQAVIQGIIPAHTRKEKDALITHLKEKLARSEKALERCKEQRDKHVSNLAFAFSNNIEAELLTIRSREDAELDAILKGEK